MHSDVMDISTIVRMLIGDASRDLRVELAEIKGWKVYVLDKPTAVAWIVVFIAHMADSTAIGLICRGELFSPV